jgi:hypothetical protein
VSIIQSRAKGNKTKQKKEADKNLEEPLNGRLAVGDGATERRAPGQTQHRLGHLHAAVVSGGNGTMAIAA